MVRQQIQVVKPNQICHFYILCIHALRPELTRVGFSERLLAYRVACMPFYVPGRPYGLLIGCSISKNSRKQSYQW